MQTFRISAIVVMILFQAFRSNCQKANEDSLRNVIRYTKSDTAKMNALLTLGNYLVLHNQDTSGLQLLEEGKKIAIQNDSPRDLARYYMMMGNYYQLINDWSSSITSLKQMQIIAEKIPNKTVKGDVLMKANNNLANLFYFNGDFTSSLEYYLMALKQVEEMPHNANSKSTLYVNIASVYRQLKLPEKSVEYINKITPLLSSIKDALKISYYYELYQNQLLKKEYQAATETLKTIHDALPVFDLNKGQQIDLTVQYFEQAGQYEMKVTKNYLAALNHFQNYLNIALKTGENFTLLEARYHVGLALDSLHRYPEAISTLKSVFTEATSLEMSEFALKSAELLTEIFKHTNNPEEGFYYAQMSLQLKDSIFAAEKIKQLNFLEGKYQSEKKEKEIADLTIANKEKELAVVKRNRLLLVVALIATGFILIFGLLYRNSKQKQLLTKKENNLQKEQLRALERQQQVVSLQSMINGQESERTRIAKDLHDGLSGLFSTVKMYFSTLQHEKEELKKNITFTKSVELIDTAAEEIRRIAHNMMPEVLMKLGLVHAVQDMCSNISAGKLLQVQLQSYGMEKRLNASTEIMLYRIVQELLTNIMKHAQASEAIVQFNRSANRLVVTVEDNGRGFSLQETDNRNHAGLETIKSRVNYLNGNITIDSQQEIGTTVIMEFLINEENG